MGKYTCKSTQSDSDIISCLTFCFNYKKHPLKPEIIV